MSAPSRKLPRRDLAAEGVEERWQPPQFSAPVTAKARAIAVLRRALDLQAATIWRDLVPLLGAEQGRVLDVGAGAQPYRGLLGTGAEYRAIDVELAGAFGYQQPDTTYYTGDRWPVEDGSVDLVLATETLEHVPQPAIFLAEARRALPDGGGLLLTVPFAARWHYVPHDYWRFTPSSLRQLLEAAGFTEIRVYPRGNAVTVAAAKVMALVLPLLFAPGAHVGLRLLGVLGLPLVVCCAAVGQASMRAPGGYDCLGYTVTATAGPSSAPAN